jgi:hypothetical protein
MYLMLSDEPDRYLRPARVRRCRKTGRRDDWAILTEQTDAELAQQLGRRPLAGPSAVIVDGNEVLERQDARFGPAQQLECHQIDLSSSRHEHQEGPLSDAGQPDRDSVSPVR